MIKSVFCAIALWSALFAGEDRTLVFSNEKRAPVTSVKDQGGSSTCWDYSGISFVEAEIIRKKGIADPSQYPALSEAFILSHSLHDRAKRYVRLEGNLRAAPGSEGADVIETIGRYGIVPRDVYPMPAYAGERSRYREFTASVRTFLKGIVDRKEKVLRPGWMDGLDDILDGFLGASAPTEFDAEGKHWTAEAYRDHLGIRPADYVSIASVTDVPYGESFVLEIFDNWRWTPSLNMPLDDIVGVLDKAVDMGYTVNIAADITQRGHQLDGYATVVPDDAPYTLSLPWEEPKTTPEIRQDLYDRKVTTDDHAMHLVGRAYDQFGRKFFVIKDSHGDYGHFGGYLYMSEEYVRRNVLHFLVHRDVLDAYKGGGVPSDYVSALKRIMADCGLPTLNLTYKDSVSTLTFTLKNEEFYKDSTAAAYYAQARPATDSSIYQACSVSKVPFAYIVCKMADDGEIDLDTPLVKYYPGILKHFAKDKLNQARARKVTARHCLTHVSGLDNKNYREPAFSFEPGERFQYSGVGIAMLQWTVEHIKGESLEPLGRRYLFDSLGMKHTNYCWQKEYEQSHLWGFRKSGVFRDQTWSGGGKCNAAYSMRTNSVEYTRFLQWFLKGADLSPDMYKEMTSKYVSTSKPGVFRALGWVREDNPALGTMLWHTGSNVSFQCNSLIVPSKGASLCYFWNGTATRSPNADIVKLFFGIRESASFGAAKD